MLFQQNTHDPAFNVSGLRAGRSYVLTVYAQNGKGRSSPVTLYSFTIKVTKVDVGSIVYLITETNCTYNNVRKHK